MWLSVLNFLSPYYDKIVKYLNPVLIGITIILILMCWYLHVCNRTLTSELATTSNRLTTVIDIYNAEMQKSKEIIDSQNKAISEYKFNLDKYTKIVIQKERELSDIEITKQQELIKELSIDSSADNQLKLMTNMLKEFSENK